MVIYLRIECIFLYFYWRVKVLTAVHFLDLKMYFCQALGTL